MSQSIILCGIGGQGIVLASKLLSYCFMKKGLNVKTTETIGMAQKGGSVVSHIRVGDDVYSPLIPKKSADIIIAFEAIEAIRNLPYLKENGVLIVNKKVIYPINKIISGEFKQLNSIIEELKEKVQNLYIVNGEKVFYEIGTEKVTNITLITIAIILEKLDLNLGDLKKGIKDIVNSKFYDMNINVVELCEKYKGDIIYEYEGRTI